MKKPNRYFILPLSTSFFNTTQWISLSIKAFYRNRCVLWAAALTYTTVFALIPLLAVTFSLFHAFGGLKELEEKIRPLILNEIWGLKKHRPFFYRLALYWTAITVGPPLLALSIGIPATLSSYQAVGWLENYINLDFFTFLPYILIWCAFTGLYTFLPNTKVRFLPAAIGGIMGGTIWQIAGIGFTLYTSKILVYSKI